MKSVGNSIHKNAVPCLNYSVEEADMRNFLHCKHVADTEKFDAIVLKTPDTDVMVLAIYFQHEIAIALIINRQSNQRRCKNVDISAICTKLGKDVCKSFPGL